MTHREAAIRAVVVGLGVMGHHHVRVLGQLPGVKLVGLCDTRDERRLGLSARTGVPSWPDADELISRTHPDVAVVAVPTTQHLQVVSPLLRAGVGVLVEKPLAESLESARELASLASRTGSFLMVGHVERFNPVVKVLGQRLQAGELGALYGLEAHRLGPFPPRIADVGVVIDLCTHDIDVITHLHPLPVVRVSAEMHRHRHSAHEDVVTGTLRFADSALASVHANWLTPIRVRTLTVTGERGMFVASYLRQQLQLVRHSATLSPDPEAILDDPQTIEIPVPRAEPLRVELEAFIRAYAAGATPAVTPQEALRVLEIAEALRVAATTGAAVELTPRPDVMPAVRADVKSPLPEHRSG